ncbi:MAG TPA: DUF4830 domain-containing protein [Firmicutes bacterium]|nr:DUF4830 domain-containing protein [Bacillota bacterium]
MFIVSLRASKYKFVVVLLSIACVLLIGSFLCRAARSAGRETGGISAPGQTLEEQAEFLSRYGWEIDLEAVEKTQITIPADWEEVYTRYNELQKTEGFDLYPYRGQQAERFRYPVTNYPDHPENVYADLLVIDGMIVGGDICCVELDGFLHGFTHKQ